MSSYTNKMRRDEYTGRVTSRIPREDWYWTRESMARPANRGVFTIGWPTRKRPRRSPSHPALETPLSDLLSGEVPADSPEAVTPSVQPPDASFRLAAPGKPRGASSLRKPIALGEWQFFDEEPSAGAQPGGSGPISALPGRPRPVRRPDRTYQNATLILSVVFAVFLFASVITSLVLVGNALKGPTPAAVAAAPQDTQPQPAAAAQPKRANQTKILLLGSDQRSGDSGFRTDVIILLVLDADQNTVTAVSFPRDLWVKVPGLYEMKINQVFALGGFDAMVALFEENFHVRPDYYVMTNFDGFSQFIDNRGGIDVEVAQKLKDACDVPQQRGGSCTVDPGTVHMDGPFALWYVRSRHTSSDIDRLRRAQEVLYATLKKTINLGTLSKLQEMKDELGENVTMNLTLEKAVGLIPITLHVLQDPGSIHSYVIDENQATEMLSWNGMWILLPDQEAVLQLLRQTGIEMEGEE